MLSGNVTPPPPIEKYKISDSLHKCSKTSGRQCNSGNQLDYSHESLTDDNDSVLEASTSSGEAKSLGSILKIDIVNPHIMQLQRELFAGNDADEFSGVLKREFTCHFNSTRGPAFISELLTVIPNGHYFKRGTYDLKKIVKYTNKKDFTSIIVVHTNRREPDALLIIESVQVSRSNNQPLKQLWEDKIPSNTLIYWYCSALDSNCNNSGVAITQSYAMKCSAYRDNLSIMQVQQCDTPTYRSGLREHRLATI